MTNQQESIVLATDQIYDLLGIGYGPAHLALSIALKESQEANQRSFKSHFLEKRTHFAWHPALLLPGSQLQVSPLKDLVTLRDPTSSYSFFNFLHSHKRLAHYINRDQHVPSRKEWTAYLAWAANRMDSCVTYGQDVISVQPMTLVALADSKPGLVTLRPTVPGRDDPISLFCIKTYSSVSDQIHTHFTRNLSVAVGGIPRVPPSFESVYHQQQQQDTPARIVHSTTFLPSLAKLEPVLDQSIIAPDARLHLAVIGGGQSATEIMIHLNRRFPTAIVTMILRASTLVPSDDTGFVNSAAFDPDRTDEFWKATEKQRQAWRKEFKRTNYSVVRSDLLKQLHDSMYDAYEVQLPPQLQDPHEAKTGRMEIKRCTQVIDVELVEENGQQRQHVDLTLCSDENHGKIETIRFDAVFLGTGFTRSPCSMKFLEPLQPFYPSLHPEWSNRDTLEDDTINEEEQDEEQLEKRRERLRGITRDYRLVPSSWNISLSLSSSGNSTPTSETSSSTSSSDTFSNEPTSSCSSSSIYVLGGNEATHGLSDSLLSIVAHRSGELTKSLLERLHESRRFTTMSNQLDQDLASSVATLNTTTTTDFEDKVSEKLNLDSFSCPLSTAN